MSYLQDLKEWWWEKTNGIVEGITQDYRFNRGTGELRYNLEKRGVLEEVENRLEEEGCECGKVNDLSEIATVSKDPDGLKLYCKACIL